MFVNPASAINYQIRRSQRVKTLRIVVKPDRVEVVAPPLMALSQIQAFVSKQQAWIQQASERVKIKAARNAIGFAPGEYHQGAEIPFQDHKLQLTLSTHRGKRTRIQQPDHSSLLLELPEQLATDMHSAAIRLALTAWMKQQAKQQAEQLIALHAPRFGLYPRSVRIKTQKSRWGSCGPYNDINLNWLLIMAPSSAFEYVVVHELCHIQHKNHSPAFWQLVEEHLPHYQLSRRWLKQHGARLMQGL